MPLSDWLDALGLSAQNLPPTARAAAPDPAGVSGFGPELSAWVRAFANQSQSDPRRELLLNDAMKWEQRRLSNPQQYWKFQAYLSQNPELLNQRMGYI